MTRAAAWVLAAGLGIAAIGLGAYRLSVSSAAGSTTTIGGPFALTDPAGAVRTDAEFHGRFLLVYFGYTNCPDVCPTTLAAVGDAMGALGAEAGRVQPVFITIDPARDTPGVIGGYVAQFSPDLLGLTGTAEQIAAVATTYHVYSARHPSKTGAAYTMDHSSILYLMGPDGRFLTTVDASLDGADLAARLREAMRVPA